MSAKPFRKKKPWPVCYMDPSRVTESPQPTTPREIRPGPLNVSSFTHCPPYFTCFKDPAFSKYSCLRALPKSTTLALTYLSPPIPDQLSFIIFLSNCTVKLQWFFTELPCLFNSLLSGHSVMWYHIETIYFPRIYIFFHPDSLTAQGSGQDYCSHFTDEETGSQRGWWLTHSHSASGW